MDSNKKFEFNKLRAMLGRQAESGELAPSTTKPQVQSAFDELIRRGKGAEVEQIIKNKPNLLQAANQSDIEGKFGDEFVRVLGHGPEQTPNTMVPGQGGFIEDISKVKGRIDVPVEELVRVRGGAVHPSNLTTIVPGSATSAPRTQASLLAEEWIEKVNKGVKGTPVNFRPVEKAAVSSAGKKFAKKALAGLAAVAGPAVGVASALSSGDLLAATPIGESTSAGEGSDITPQSVYDRAEGGYMSPQRFERLRKILK